MAVRAKTAKITKMAKIDRKLPKKFQKFLFLFFLNIFMLYDQKLTLKMIKRQFYGNFKFQNLKTAKTENWPKQSLKMGL